MEVIRDTSAFEGVADSILSVFAVFVEVVRGVESVVLIVVGVVVVVVVIVVFAVVVVVDDDIFLKAVKAVILIGIVGVEVVSAFLLLSNFLFFRPAMNFFFNSLISEGSDGKGWGT